MFSSENTSTLRRYLMIDKISRLSFMVQSDAGPMRLCEFCCEQFKQMMYRETELRFQITEFEVLRAKLRNCFLCRMTSGPNKVFLFREDGSVTVTLTAHRSRIPEDNNRISRCVVRAGYHQYSFAPWADLSKFTFDSSLRAS